MDHTGKLPFSSRKKIFITGCAGFIGFHLAEYLSKRGDTVIGCDNFNSYYDPNLKRARAKILQEQGIVVHEADICDRPFLEQLFAKEKFSHVVHLAAQAGVRYSMIAPESYVHSNLNGFVQLLETCKNHLPLKLIYASSSSVYGLNKKVPFSEEDVVDTPSNFYGATKKANEVIAHAYHHLYKIPVTGLRFFTVYGPWGRPDMAYFSFTQAITNGKPISLFNHGVMERDFTYIDDIVKGTAAAIDLGSECEVFNLGNNKPQTLMSLVSTLEKHLNKTADKQYLPMQPGETLRTCADITKSKRSLGFEPSFSLDLGLKNFVEWYQNYYKV